MSYSDRQFGIFCFKEGKRISFSFKINPHEFSRMVWRAAHNKNGKSKLLKGAFEIEAKILPEGEEIPA